MSDVIDILADADGNLFQALPQLFDSRLSKIWNNLAVTVEKLGAKAHGNKNISFAVQLNKASVGYRAEGADISTVAMSTKKPAKLDWTHLADAFGPSTHEINACLQSMGGAEELVDIIMNELDLVASAQASKMNQSFWKGNGSSNTPVGFWSALTAASYAGIVKADYPEFTGTVDTTVEALTGAKLDAMLSSIYIKSGKRPTAIFTSPSGLDKYRGLFYNNQVFVKGISQYDYSPETLTFRNIPVYQDKDLEDGLVDGYGADQGKAPFAFVYTPDVEHYYMPQRSRFQTVIAEVQAHSSNGTESVNIGVPLYLEKLAKTGISEKMMLQTTHGFAIRNLRSQGVIKAVTL